MLPPFLNTEQYYKSFHNACFYEQLAYNWDKHARKVKKLKGEDWGHFRIVRSRGYSFEWWKDYIGIVFYGIMSFHKSAEGFWYLDNVTPVCLIDGEMLQGKTIHTSALEFIEETVTYSLILPEPKHIDLPDYNRWEEVILRNRKAS